MIEAAALLVTGLLLGLLFAIRPARQTFDIVEYHLVRVSLITLSLIAFAKVIAAELHSMF